MRLFLFMSVPFVLLLIVLLLFDTDGSTPAAQAQAVDGASARQLFLPYIATGAAPIKSKSGIHLGNRVSSDWRAELFTLITGTTGTWPAAVVVQSNQVYSLTRTVRTVPTSECRITGATLKLTGEGEPYNVYKYLTQAVAAGTKVLIRITPSPGNFADYAEPGINHTLLATPHPAGGDYCDKDAAGVRDDEKFRDVLDLAQEMDAIYDLNLRNHWPADSFYFEPANEPNYEWYQAFQDNGKDIEPLISHKNAWIAMDEYFAALYDQGKAINTELQILTPPMSQRLFGEHFGLGSCDTWTVTEGGQHSGLDFMKKTFGYDFDASTQSALPKADGFSLHNYWRLGQEGWEANANISLDFYCDYTGGGIQGFHIPSDHLSQHLPDGIALTMRLSGKPILISEADLLSPCQYPASTLISKDRIPSNLNNYPGVTAQSLQTFVTEEYTARAVIAWLLTNEYDGDGVCANPNTEITWHEIYREMGEAREWFQLWWPKAQ